MVIIEGIMGTYKCKTAYKKVASKVREEEDASEELLTYHNKMLRNKERQELRKQKHKGDGHA